MLVLLESFDTKRESRELLVTVTKYMEESFDISWIEDLRYFSSYFVYFHV